MFKYNGSRPFEDENISVDIRTGKVVLINNQANNSIAVLDFHDGLSIACQEIGNKVYLGYMDTSLRAVIPPQFDWVTHFEKGYAPVMKNQRWGVINQSGNIVIPLIFEFIERINENRFLVFKENKYGVLDSTGTVILPLEYNSLYYLFEGLYATNNGEKWGAINEQEKIILNYEYDVIIDSLALKTCGSFPLPTSLIRVKYDFQGQYFNTAGLTDKARIYFSKLIEGKPYFLDQKYIRYDLFTPLKDEINRKSDKYYYYMPINEEYSVVGDRQVNDELFPFGVKHTDDRYDYNRYVYAGDVIKYGVINKIGDTIIPIVYDAISYDGSNRLSNNELNLFVVTIENDARTLSGVLNINNTFIIDLDNLFIQIIGSKIVVRKGYETAIYDFTGKLIAPFKEIKYREGTAGSIRAE
ncbi:WG repeat-containing protein [Bacteroidales bacterium OttesenSCG-928-A14]|nr:WG repeat-containing protein [Bacteroidales bacterium OttesenSCG-928-A14]